MQYCMSFGRPSPVAGGPRGRTTGPCVSEELRWPFSCGRTGRRTHQFWVAYQDLCSGTIVTYNKGRFIRRCLESVLDQKYPNLEIIVIDNSSTDGTADILEQFADRCKVIHNSDNIGFAAAQNQAIALSGGDWILTLNPDVLLLPGFLEA